MDSADDEGDVVLEVEKSGGGSTGGLSHLEKHGLKAAAEEADAGDPDTQSGAYAEAAPCLK